MDTLYHYCSIPVFHSIITNQEIWLSSLLSSNDSMEGKIAHQIVNELCAKHSLNSDSLAVLQDALEFSQTHADCLGFCLSEKQDQLSQWRGYADDGRGFAIGFNKNYLEELSKKNRRSSYAFEIRKVNYEQTLQELTVKPFVVRVIEMISEGALARPENNLLGLLSEQSKAEAKKAYEKNIQELYLESSSLLFKTFRLKHPAFAEEAEWRLLNYVPIGGGKDTLFRATKDRLVPYKTLKLAQLNMQPVNEVIIGPKNNTMLEVIERILSSNLFENVKVIKSQSTYR